jgi:hypothetical protein
MAAVCPLYVLYPSMRHPHPLHHAATHSMLPLVCKRCIVHLPCLPANKLQGATSQLAVPQTLLPTPGMMCLLLIPCAAILCCTRCKRLARTTVWHPGQVPGTPHHPHALEFSPPPPPPLPHLAPRSSACRHRSIGSASTPHLFTSCRPCPLAPCCPDVCAASGGSCCLHRCTVKRGTEQAVGHIPPFTPLTGCTAHIAAGQR